MPVAVLTPRSFNVRAAARCDNPTSSTKTERSSSALRLSLGLQLETILTHAAEDDTASPSSRQRVLRAAADHLPLFLGERCVDV